MVRTYDPTLKSRLRLVPTKLLREILRRMARPLMISALGSISAFGESAKKKFLINSCILHLESEFFKSAPASNAKASASDHDVAVLGAPARSIAIEETARLLAGTETPVSPVTRKVYEILKARRAGLKDYLPTVNHDVKTRKWNPEYSLLDGLRRKARADKLGTRSSSSIKAFSTTSE